MDVQLERRPSPFMSRVRHAFAQCQVALVRRHKAVCGELAGQGQEGLGKLAHSSAVAIGERWMGASEHADPVEKRVVALHAH